MENQDALAFLRRHQSQLKRPSAAFMDCFHRMLNILSKNPDEDSIPLIINSFGDCRDMSLYEKLQSLLRQFPPEKVHPHLLTGLTSRNDNMRSWCADTVRYFPHKEFIPILGNMLKEKNVLVRYASATGLEAVCSPEVRVLAENALAEERDRDVRGVLEDILNTCVCA